MKSTNAFRRIRSLGGVIGVATSILLLSGAAAYATDYRIVNRDGGDTGAYSYATGEYTRAVSACGIVFYISRREGRWDRFFAPGGTLIRKSNNQILCRWGNW